MIRSGIQIIPHGRLSKSIVFVMVATKEINPTARGDHPHTIFFFFLRKKSNEYGVVSSVSTVSCFK